MGVAKGKQLLMLVTPAYVNQGEHILYHDRTYLGKTCSLLPFGSGRDELHVHTEGLEWNLRTS